MANDRKDKKVEVRMTEKQKILIENAAKTAGLSSSAWMLSVCLRVGVKPEEVSITKWGEI